MTDDRVRAARLVVGNYVEPHLGMPLADAKAVKSVRLRGRTGAGGGRTGLPARRGPGPNSTQILQATAGCQPGGRARRVSACGWQRGRHAVQGGLQPLPGIAQRHRGGVRQGRRRQVHDRGQPRAGAGARRRAGRPAGRRHLRPEPAAHDRACRASVPMSRDGKRMEPLVAHGIKVMSIGFLIEEEQPMVWRGPMVTQALTQLLSRHELGRTRLPRRRHAARHRRHPAHAGAARAGERRGRRDDAAGHRAARRAQGSAGCSRRSRCRCSASSRT